MNYLVSPYYPESGGTVIDWMNGNWSSDEIDGEDFDFREGKDDDLPF